MGLRRLFNNTFKSQAPEVQEAYEDLSDGRGLNVLQSADFLSQVAANAGITDEQTWRGDLTEETFALVAEETEEDEFAGLPEAGYDADKMPDLHMHKKEA